MSPIKRSARQQAVLGAIRGLCEELRTWYDSSAIAARADKTGGWPGATASRVSAVLRRLELLGYLEVREARSGTDRIRWRAIPLDPGESQ